MNRDLTSEPTDLDEVPTASSMLHKAEVEDLERELRIVQGKAKRHLLWTLLGLSPSAIIPALGLMREGSFGLLVLLALLVMASQGYLGAKASKKAEGLEKALEILRIKE